MSNLPNEYIVTEKISTKIDGITFDFEVKISVYGEVLEANTSFWDLPELAQKMTLGEKGEETLEKLKAYPDLLFYQIAFALRDLISVDGLEGLIRSLKQKRNNLKVVKKEQKRDLLDIFALEYIDKYLLKNPKLESEDQKTSIKPLLQLLESPGEYKIQSNFLQCRLFKLSPDIIRKIFPFIRNSNYVNIALRVLDYNPSEENRLFLIKEIKNENSQILKIAFLDRLAAYTDNKTLDFVVEYFNSSATFNTYEIERFLNLLGGFKGDKVMQIAWDHLISIHNDHSYYSYVILKNNGVSEEELVQRLIPILKDANTIPSWEPVLNVLTLLKKETLLPKGDLFFPMMENWIDFKKQEDPSLFHTISRVWYRTMDDKDANSLFEMLEGENEDFKKAALIIINKTFYHKRKIPDSLQLGKKVEFELKKIVSGEIRILKTLAIAPLCRIASFRNDPNLILFLIQELEGNERFLTTLIVKINSIIGDIEMDDLISPFFLRVLNHPNKRIRFRGINGAAKIKSKAIKEKLKQMKNDPYDNIRRSIIRLEKRNLL